MEGDYQNCFQDLCYQDQPLRMTVSRNYEKEQVFNIEDKDSDEEG